MGTNYVRHTDIQVDGTLKLPAGANMLVGAGETEVDLTELGILGGITADADEINVLDGVTAGTRTASKAIVVDGSGTIDALDVTSLSLGAVAVTAAAADINSIAASTKVWTVLPTDFRVKAAWKDALPDAGNDTSYGLSDTAGSPIVGSSANNNSKSETGVFNFALPAEYVDGGTITVRVRAKLGAAVNVGATVDCVAKVYSDGALGSDICATAAQAITGDDTYANFDFTITPTSRVSGEILHIELPVVNNDTGGSANTPVSISHVEMRLNAR